MLPTKITKARIRDIRNNKWFEVHFNPEKLQYIISNTVPNTGLGNTNKQYTAKSTGKLTLELIYDTTGTGEDVRLHTVHLARFMEPGISGNRTPPVVEFDWGLYNITGLVERYCETIDYFSANGVPLRATVNLTISKQDKKIDRSPSGKSLSSTIQTPLLDDKAGRGVTQIATMAGNPNAGRQIAAANGIENMRFPGEIPIELDADASTSALASSDGSGNERYDGLRTTTQPSSGLDLSSFSQPSPTATLNTEDASTFAIGGHARLQGSPPMKVDVGTAGALSDRIAFDGGQ